MAEPAKRITLILGGARSGKSHLAEKLAQSRAAGSGGVLYVATLAPADAEMRERVIQHRASRPATWRTLEAPFDLTGPVLAALQGERLVLLDCLTIWTANRLLAAMEPGLLTPPEIFEEELPPPPTGPDQPAPAAKPADGSAADPLSPPTQSLTDYRALEEEMGAELDRLLAGLRGRGVGLALVSNEVGMGLVPPYPLGRAYRDMLGRLNQRLAAQADEVFFVLAGIPVDLKRLQVELE
jgi:adenosylcobinamide kinase / adenosylcobinamide-phosphate guanylyltransferase